MISIAEKRKKQVNKIQLQDTLLITPDNTCESIEAVCKTVFQAIVFIAYLAQYKTWQVSQQIAKATASNSNDEQNRNAWCYLLFEEFQARTYFISIMHDGITLMSNATFRPLTAGLHKAIVSTSRAILLVTLRIIRLATGVRIESEKTMSDTYLENPSSPERSRTYDDLPITCSNAVSLSC